MAILKYTLESQGVPGGAFVVVEGGQLAGLGVAGSKRGASCDPITPDTLFNAGVMSGLISTIGVLDAVEEGKLDLDAPITTAVDSVWVEPSEHGAASDITLRNLLNRTSGYRALVDQWWSPGPCVSLEDSVQNAEVPLLYSPPGAMYHMYHRSNAQIAGLALERADGIPYEDAARARVLDPLAMAGGYGESAFASGDFSFGHDNLFVDSTPPTECAADDPSIGYYGSPLDLAKLFGYLTGGPGDILQTALTAPDGMLAPQGPHFWTTDYAAFGLDGWRVEAINDDILYGFQSGFGFSTGFWFFKERRLAIVVVLNAVYGSPSDLILGLPPLFDPTLSGVDFFETSCVGDPTLVASVAGTYVDPIGLNGDGVARTLTLTYDPTARTELAATVEVGGETQSLALGTGSDIGYCADNFMVCEEPLDGACTSDDAGTWVRIWRDAQQEPYAVAVGFDGGPPFYRVSAARRP